MSYARADWVPNGLPREFWWLGPVVLAELLLLVGYFGATGAELTSVRYAVYPFVWIDVALVAVVRLRPASAGPRLRLAAAAAAVAYFVVLAWLAGLIALYPGGGGHSHAYMTGVVVQPAAPGWGPRLGYVTELFHVYFVPYRVIGYAALAYLLYASVIDASKAAFSGVLGVLACLGCAFPLLSAVAGGLLGSGAAAAAYGASMDVSTAVFVLAVALLSWRPER